MGSRGSLILKLIYIYYCLIISFTVCSLEFSNLFPVKLFFSFFNFEFQTVDIDIKKKKKKMYTEFKRKDLS